MKVIFFIILITCVTSFNLTKVSLKKQKTYDLLLDCEESINLTVRSKYNRLFQVEAYEKNGKSSLFKGINVEFIGDFSYVQIYNLDKETNKIYIYNTSIQEDSNIIEHVFSILSIITCILILVFDTKSNIIKVLLTMLLLIEIFQYGHIHVGTKFRPNILKIK